MAEGGEGGEPSAQTGGEEKTGLLGKSETCGERVEQSDEEASRHVDAKSGPREREGGDVEVEERLHAVAHQASEASSQKNRDKYPCHIRVWLRKVRAKIGIRGGTQTFLKLIHTLISRLLIPVSLIPVSCVFSFVIKVERV